MESTEGRRLHGLAAQARERGEFLEALQLTDEALIAYQNDKDLLGFAECLADRSIALRHLADKYNDSVYLILAKAELEAAVTIAEKSGDKTTLALPYHNLGKVNEDLKDFEAAVEAHKKAVDNITNNPPYNHNRAAVIAEFKIHLSESQYKNGDQSALQRLEQAITDLEAVPTISDGEYEKKNKQLDFNEEVPSNKAVWLSGGYMKLAEILKDKNPEKAKEALQKAKEIIDSDERLTLRKAQWEKLAKTFN